MRVVTANMAYKKLVVISVFIAFCVATGFLRDNRMVLASAFGPSPSHTGAPGENNCTSCHTSNPVNSGDGNIQILGVPEIYVEGQQIALTVVLNHEDATNYGFQFTAVDSQGQGVGTFTVPSQYADQIQILNGIVGPNTRQYVEHTSEGLFTDGLFGSNSWTFYWTAPVQAVGKIDFYAAGNGANGDGGTAGDYIYTANTSSLAAAGPLVSISGKVFSPSGLALRNAKVILTDANNIQRVTVTSSFGQYSFSEVASGMTYSLNAQTKRYRFAAKTLTINVNLSDINFTGLE